ncbi:MAG: nucleotide exchange factor GrpE [Deltaproteobacteria bacterium]|nr:nucleotide exchange factor GrpE [Deltaproteobacteria bacterium]
MNEEHVKDGQGNEEPVGDEEKDLEGASEGLPQEDPDLEELSREALIEHVQALRKSRDEISDRHLRTQAEMENMKKRHRKEIKDWQRFANEKLIKEILPVMDNLEMAIGHTGEENALEALREGVELTLKGLREALGRAGVQKVETEGEDFDPNYHEAISVQEDPNRAAGTVLHELQKGYVLNSRLIRPALVIVNQGTSGEGKGPSTDEAFDSENK